MGSFATGVLLLPFLHSYIELATQKLVPQTAVWYAERPQVIYNPDVISSVAQVSLGYKKEVLDVGTCVL